MKKLGIVVDYSNICKEYNTVYLDRDNKDPATSKCMKQVLSWAENFLSELLEHFSYKLFNLSSNVNVEIDDVASKRFLFYSLEKEITLQSYVVQKEYKEYAGLSAWEMEEGETLLIQNDADGGCLYFYTQENSKELMWMKEKLHDFSLDEIPFEAK
jgi:hypothetical protein